MSEWISVKDKLPDELEEVLVFDGNAISTAYISWYEYDKTPRWQSDGSLSFTATHWMPLPNLPDDKKLLEE